MRKMCSVISAITVFALILNVISMTSCAFDFSVILPEGVSFFESPPIVKDGDNGYAWHISNNPASLRINMQNDRIYRLKYDVRAVSGGTGIVSYTQSWTDTSFAPFTWEADWILRYPGSTDTGLKPDFKNEYLTVEYIMNTSSGETQLRITTKSGKTVYSEKSEARNNVILPQYIQIRSFLANETGVYFKNLSFESILDGVSFSKMPKISADGDNGEVWNITNDVATLKVNMQSDKIYSLKYDVKAVSGGTGIITYTQAWQSSSFMPFTWEPDWTLKFPVGEPTGLTPDFQSRYLTVEYIMNTSSGVTRLIISSGQGEIIYSGKSEPISGIILPKYIQIRSFSAAENGVYFKNLSFGEYRFEPNMSSICDGQTDVKTDAPIYVAFNDPVNKEDIKAEKFLLVRDDGNSVEYSLETTEDFTSVVFITNGLDIDTNYRIVISGNISTSEASVMVNGNSYEKMGEDYIIRFKTKPSVELSSQVKLYDFGNGYITVAAEVNFEISKSAEAIAVIYDENNRIKDLKTKIISADDTDKIAFSFEKADGISENSVAKMFVWSLEEKMKPLDISEEKGYAERLFAPMEIFVSPDSTGGDGSFETPFKTITQARDYIRTLQEYPKGGIVVNLRGGVYDINETILFEKEDSGTADTPIVYRGYLNEKPVIKAYKTLDISDFKPYDYSLENIPEDKSPFIKVLDLSKYNIDVGKLGYQGTNESSALWSELIYNGETMTLARYPNDRTLGCEFSAERNDFISRQSTDDSDGAELTPFKWRIDDNVVKKISASDDIYCYNWFAPTYIAAFEKVKKLSDNVLALEKFHNENGSAIINAPKTYSYYLVNSPAFLDSEKEYYIDREQNKLYFYMPSEKCFEIGMTCFDDSMIKTTDADNITFRNLVFSGGKGSAFVIGANSENIDIENCVIRNFASNAIVFEGCRTTKNSNIRNCEIFDMGSCGIIMTCGENKTLTPANIKIYNNKIHAIGRIRMYQSAAIKAEHTASVNYFDGTPGVYVGYNEIFDSNEWSVLLGADSVMEYNDIHNVAKYSDDTGAVYWGGDVRYGAYVARGRKILNNYIHDIETKMTKPYHGARGIYMDGCTEVTVSGNIVENTNAEPYLSSSSGLHTVENNIFIGKQEKSGVICETIQIDNGGNYGLSSDEVKRYIPKYSYDSPLWIAKYPNIKRYLEQKDGIVHKPGHIFRNNIIYNCEPIVINEAVFDCEFTDISHNWQGKSDPGFTDFANRDYSLKSDAPVLSELSDFKATDMTLIGTLEKRTNEKLKNSTAIRNYSNLYYENGEVRIMQNSAFLADDNMYADGEIFRKYGISAQGIVSVKDICSANNLCCEISGDICIISDSETVLKNDEKNYISEILNKY